jgi:hypothetical protein
VETNDDITLKDKPKDKVVHKEVPKNIKSFLKQQNQEFVKFDLSGGHSIFGESLIMEAKSLSDNSSIRYMFRQFKPIRDFEWEYYISKEMGEMEVAPKIIFADHKTKFWLQQFVENSITLKPLVYPPESLKQTGVLLKKFHSFSSKIKVPDSYDFFDKVKMNALRIIGSHPMLSRFKRTVEGVDQILKIFEKIVKNAFAIMISDMEQILYGIRKDLGSLTLSFLECFINILILVHLFHY